MSARLRLTIVAAVLGALACGRPEARTAAVGADADPQVGFDLRRLRPRNEEPLADMFERLREATVREGKVAAVLFSADWCAPCRTLDLELGNVYAATDIGHVRVFELKEEDWQAATRMNEFNALRQRWYAPVGSYPVLVVLDGRGEAIEEMKAAAERLTAAGVEPTLPHWFRELRPGAATAGAQG